MLNLNIKLNKTKKKEKKEMEFFVNKVEVFKIIDCNKKDINLLKKEYYTNINY